MLLLLPERLLESELPALLTRLALRLKERDIGVRKATRRALADVCVELGTVKIS